MASIPQPEPASTPEAVSAEAPSPPCERALPLTAQSHRLHPTATLFRALVIVALSLFCLTLVLAALPLMARTGARSTIAAALDESISLLGLTETDLRQQGVECWFAGGYATAYEHCIFVSEHPAIRRVQLFALLGVVAQMNVWPENGTRVGDLIAAWGSPVVVAQPSERRYALTWPDVAAEAMVDVPVSQLNLNARVTVVTISKPMAR